MKTEREILELLKSGDEEALRYIFNTYFERLCLYAEGIIHDHHAAEDIVEELFVTVWLHAGSNPIHTTIKNYLYTSVYHNCLQYLNKRRTENNKIEQMRYAFSDWVILNPDSRGYPISELMVSEIEKKAETILESLPDQCRKIYTLNRFDNLNYPEIAAKLSITVGTVKTQMSRAFQRFREGLKEYLPSIIFSVTILFFCFR